jgi:5-methylcytosine-specific restriction endonuclease McrA
LDHVVALQRGGTNEPTNLQGLCRRCHLIKSGCTPRPTIGVDGWPRT